VDDPLCLVAQLLSIYALVLFARIIVSWVTMFRPIPASLAPLVRVLYDLTEPVMSFFRRFIPPVGGLDLSPIVIFIVIRLLRGALCGGGL
jgi:YggT family protein